MSSALSVGMAIDPAVLFPRVRGTARRDAARRGAARRDTVALPTWRFGLVYDTCPMSATDWDAALQRMLGRIVATGGQVTDGFPHYGDPATGRWTTSPAGDWTGGFWNGLCWLAAHATGKDPYREWALAWTERLRSRATSDTVFRGFLFYYGALLGAVLLGDSRAREMALEGAAGWARSYNAGPARFRSAPRLKKHRMWATVRRTSTRCRARRSWCGPRAR